KSANQPAGTLRYAPTLHAPSFQALCLPNLQFASLSPTPRPPCKSDIHSNAAFFLNLSARESKVGPGTPLGLLQMVKGES
ncbi:MAG: hypothetical protein NZM11_13100, partial [Anaerolineales bacterium]|nr:hypothetical protein [Anaerolineales bacterium]